MIEAIYPTTPSQQGFLLGTLTSPSADSVFIEQQQVCLRGPLDVDRFSRIWRDTVSAHEILRTGFAWNVSDEPRQVVLREALSDVEVLDLSDTPSADRSLKVENVLQEHRAKPFDLRRPPLVRLMLVRMDQQNHLLIWTHHHGILDGWSQVKLLNEMVARYNGEPTFPSLPFGQYAAWLSKQSTVEKESFWRSFLGNHTPTVPLRPLSSDGTPETFGTVEMEVSGVDLNAMRKLAREANITEAGIILSLWAIALKALRNQTSMMIGVTVSGRTEHYPDSLNILGPFVNTIPLEVSVDPSAKLISFASRLQADLARASQFGDCSAGQIHRWLNSPTNSRLFDAVVAIDNYPKPDTGVSGDSNKLCLSQEETRAFGGRTLHPLSLVISLQDKQTLRLVYRSEFITREEANELVDDIVRNVRVLSEHGLSIENDELLKNSRVIARSNSMMVPEDRDNILDSEPGSIETTIAEAFASTLGLQRFSVTDNFVAFGGHSILALELLQQLRKRLDVDLTLYDLIQFPTPATIASRVRQLLSIGATDQGTLPNISERGPEGEPFDLTEIQQAYWVGRQKDFEFSSVDAQLYYEVDVVQLDVGRLAECWNIVVRRHDMLRAIVTNDGTQTVLGAVPYYNIETFDFRAQDDCEERILLIRDELSNARRRLDEWPLFAVKAAFLPNGKTRLFLSFDLLIGDALTWKVLYSDVLALYQNPLCTLPPLEIGFRDYAMAVNRLKDTPAYLRDKEYWKGRLNTLPSPPDFPLSRQSRGRVGVFKRREFRLDPQHVKLLRQRASELGATPSALLLTLFGEILARFTGSQDLLLNLTIFNRLPIHPQVNRLVGDFTSLSMTAVRARSEGETLADAVRRLQRQLWQDLDHRLYSGISVMRDLASVSGDYHKAQAPVVFTSSLEFSNVAAPSGQPWSLEYGIGQTPQVVLDYQTFAVGEEVVIIWDAVEGAFPIGYLDAMFDAHRRLLYQIIVNGVSSIDIQADAETTTELPIPHPRSNQLLYEPFVQMARANPDNYAVLTETLALTYQQLLNSTVEIAHSILAEDPTGRVVAIIMEKGWEQVVGVLGALISGRTFVPLDPRWPLRRILGTLARTGATAILTQPHLRDRFSEQAGVVLAIDQSIIKATCRPLPPHDVGPGDVAYIIFTSGSSGEPKGVVIQHRSALNTILEVNDLFDVGGDDRTFAISPLEFDLSIYDIFGLLSAGGAIVIPSAADDKNPIAWVRVAARFGVTIWNSVPAIMKLATDALSNEVSLRSLRICLLSGDWIPTSLPSAIWKALPATKIVSLGGATEGSIWSIYYPITHVDPDWSSIPYGFPLRGQTVEILSHDRKPCEVWVPGDIYIGGHGVASGYVGDDELSSKSFIFDHRKRYLYRTGDRGRLLPDGSIEFLGRNDGQVKINGYRIETREVEAAIAAIAGVDSAAVIALGERENRVLVGFFSGQVSEQDALDALRLSLPGYMLPTVLTRLHAMPLSATAKVDRGALASMASAAFQTRPPGQSASSPVDELATLVQEITGVFAEETSNLLALGVTSIGVIRLFNAIERLLSKRPNAALFYQEPSIRALRRQIGTPGVTGSGHRMSKSQALDELVLCEPTSEPAILGPVGQLDKISSASGFTQETSRSPVQLKLLARALECLCSRKAEKGTKFLYPSGGGLYAVDLHVLVGRNAVVDVERGHYRYAPHQHALLPVTGAIGSGHFEGICDDEDLILFFTTELRNSAPLYGEEAIKLAALEAGYMVELLRQEALENEMRLSPADTVTFCEIQRRFLTSESTLLQALNCTLRNSWSN